MAAQDDIASFARLALMAYLRTAEWMIRTAAEALGVALPDGRAPVTPEAMRTEPPTAAAAAAQRTPTLRERGEELLRRSADVREDEDAHPAYGRILDELLPDEARILRLMWIAGPQPAVDVRAGALPLNATTELIAPGLTMIGAEAGCRRSERVPAYLDNLYRLGLIWFSREPVGEQSRYQVLEAQPDVVEALRSKGRARTVRRSIALTPFGADFCENVLPPTTAEFAALQDPLQPPPSAAQT
jgi:hypothetical protein